MSVIIAFANQKGGVGKTTSAVNITACIGALGKKTLLIDLDPQGNATSGLGISKKKLTASTYELLLGTAVPKETVLKTPYSNVSLIPSNINLSGAEFDLFDMENREHRLASAIEQLRSDYDYIIIDCPPSLGMLTLNALTASDGIVVPMQCEYYSLEGLGMLMSTVGKIRSHFNEKLAVYGILLTMYNGRLVLTMQVVQELKKYYKDLLFSTTISRNVRLTEAPGFGVPVYYHDKYCKGSLEYMAAAKELLDRC